MQIRQLYIILIFRFWAVR